MVSFSVIWGYWGFIGGFQASSGPSACCAAGGNLEGIVRHKVDATGNPTSTTIGASFMNWRGDIALGGNAQTQVNYGKDTQITGRANLNRRAWL